jgi:hypothetical protein
MNVEKQPTYKRVGIFLGGDFSDSHSVKVGCKKDVHYSGVKKTPKRYFLHYQKGKYNLINLALKKKGHDQKFK